MAASVHRTLAVMGDDLPDPEPDGARAGAPLGIRGPGGLLLDEPFLVEPRGADPGETLVWRGRLRDDDQRVWRANAARPQDLGRQWAPSKGPAGPIPALASLRPVTIELRVELPDRRAATREITRVLLADGVRVRRWREGVTGTLLRPADEIPVATVVIDARDPDPSSQAVAALSGALLASRGVLLLIVLPARANPAGDGALQAAAEQVVRVPGARADIRVLGVCAPGAAAEDGPGAVVLPAGIPGGDPAEAGARAARWDALLADLGARPRPTARQD